MAKAKEKQADFGFRRVPLGDKQALVDDVFHSVARRYDLMNDLMSGGLHRAWKEALVTAVNPPKGGQPFALLDLAGGTGDVAFRVADENKNAGDTSVPPALCRLFFKLRTRSSNQYEPEGSRSGRLRAGCS